MNIMIGRLKCLLLLLASVIMPAVKAQQVSDTGFHYPIPHPAYAAGKGPVILFDEFHNNPFTLKGHYSAFAKLLSRDGYRLRSSREKLSQASLADAKIYVTVNALYDFMDWDLPARSAFSHEEVDALVDWVRTGGSLFLVTDHMPCAAAVNAIAERFGFNLINGFAIQKDGKPEMFSRSRSNLHNNVITSPPGAKIDSIRCWGSSGFIAPPEATVISSLGDSYTIYLPAKVSEMTYPIADTIPSISGTGLVNGAFLPFGNGRVVVFADGAPFSAQLEGIKSVKRGMNHPNASQNAQLLLNIIHWLDNRL